MEATEHSNEETRSNAGQQPADADPSSSAHITFPPVPDSEKASRHEMRKKWRAPLYQLPLGVNSCHHSLSCSAACNVLLEGDEDLVHDLGSHNPPQRCTPY